MKVTAWQLDSRERSQEGTPRPQPHHPLILAVLHLQFVLDTPNVGERGEGLPACFTNQGTFLKSEELTWIPPTAACLLTCILV